MKWKRQGILSIHSKEDKKSHLIMAMQYSIARISAESVEASGGRSFLQQIQNAVHLEFFKLKKRV